MGINKAERSSQSFESYFSQRTRRGLRLFLPLIGVLHAVAAAACWLTAPHEQALGFAAFSALVALAAAAGAALVARGEHRLLAADGIATCVLLLALCNSLLHVVSGWSPLAVVTAALFVAAAGAVSSGHTPLYVVPTAVHGWWALLATADNWSAEWLQFEAALLTATLAAFGLHYSRRKVALELFEGERRLESLAQRDPLTSLPIRPALIDRVGECLARSKRNAERTFGLCVLNLDGFEKLNTQHGHAQGDLLLQTVAERLRVACRRSDMVARLGGDEFAILLDETPTHEHADAGADRLCGLSCAPVNLDGVAVEISASYGVVFSGAGFQSEEAMLSAAHAEMQRSKERYHVLARAFREQPQIHADSAQELPAPA